MQVKDPYRGTGRTRRMVLSLPEIGQFVVIVHNHVMKRHVEDMISRERSRDVRKAAKVIVIERESDVNQVRGLDVPFFVDHAWSDNHPLVWLAPYVRKWGVVR